MINYRRLLNSKYYAVTEKKNQVYYAKDITAQMSNAG